MTPADLVRAAFDAAADDAPVYVQTFALGPAKSPRIGALSGTLRWGTDGWVVMHADGPIGPLRRAVRGLRGLAPFDRVAARRRLRRAKKGWR